MSTSASEEVGQPSLGVVVHVCVEYFVREVVAGDCIKSFADV